MSYEDEDEEEQETGGQSCKVVLLGEAGVGKTSIISSFITRKFDVNIMTTTGASFAAKSLMIDKQNTEIKFEIWDTAGQEKFRALTKLFYKDASIAILVYDITRKESFDELVNYWYTQVKDTVTTNILYAVCANKSDLYEKEEVNEEIARIFATDIKATFVTTSAKNSNGIDTLFQNLGSRFLDPNEELNSVSEKTAQDPKKGDQTKGKNIKLKTKEQDIEKDSMNDRSRCC